MAVSRISRANGNHCQATMMTIEVSGSDENQSTAGRPNSSATQDSTPLEGCIIMFFHTRALTVGMTKNGEMASPRAMPRPGNSCWNSTARRPP